VILPPPPKTPTSFARLLRRFEKALDALPDVQLGARLPLDHASALLLLCPSQVVLQALEDTGRDSERQRLLPAHHVVYFVLACSVWRDKSLPNVWLQLHPLSERPQPPDPSALVHARKRLGVRPLRLLFRRLVCGHGPLQGAFYKCWRLLALDGTAFELPDTPENAGHFGRHHNQHGPAAFPQAEVAALCEVLSHAVIDLEAGLCADSEQALSVPLLQRLPPGCLVLMDRGLSYFGLVAQVKARQGEVLARVKVSRRLPVERELPDGSYLSSIYPDSNSARAGRGGLAVRVVCYSHDDPGRAGRGGLAVLITTVLDFEALSAKEAVGLYPWRWAEESVLAELKTAMQKGKQPLLRGKTPQLVYQELYGLFLGHFLIRKAMAQAAQLGAVAPSRLSFTDSLEVMRKWLSEQSRQGWKRRYRVLLANLAQTEMREKRDRPCPRQKKAARQRWPMKKAGAAPPRKPSKPFAQAAYVVGPPPAVAEDGSGP
jgi:Insertion element 4 transposase N-terminal/Transposase DDE domain